MAHVGVLFVVSCQLSEAVACIIFFFFSLWERPLCLLMELHCYFRPFSLLDGFLVCQGEGCGGGVDGA